MDKYLPSKKFLIILSSIISAILIVWLASFIINHKPAPAKLSKAEVGTKIQEFMALDSDNDGLKDWEEALYKTDPKNPDTDGDGTTDGEEVQLNRDPLKANTAPKGQTPNDKIDEKVIAREKKAEEDFAKLSETDKMGELMFSQYLATKKVGQTLSQTDIASIVQNTLTQMPTISFKQYSLADLTISPINTSDSLKKFGNDVAQIIMTDLVGNKLASQNYDFYGFAQVKNLMQVMDDNSTDIKTLNQTATKLNPVISQYQMLINDLLKVTVPNNLADKHLTLINTLELIYDNLSQIKNAVGNIVVLPQLLTSYQENIRNVIPAIIMLKNAFIENHIIFTSADFGSRFFSDIIK